MGVVLINTNATSNNNTAQVNKLKVQQMQTTSPDNIQPGYVSLQYVDAELPEDQYISNLVFNTDFSKYLNEFKDVAGSNSFVVKITNLTKETTLLGTVTNIANTEVKITIATNDEKSFTTQEIDVDDELIVELDFANGTTKNPTTTNITALSTTFDGTQKGLHNIYKFNNSNAQTVTIDADDYNTDDLGVIQRGELGGTLEIKAATGQTLKGVRNINNKFLVNDPNSFVSFKKDIDGKILIFGNLTRGYTGAVTTTSYSELTDNTNPQDITVTGTGFSENMISPVLSGNATLNSWTYVSPTLIILNITPTGIEGDNITVTYDNGDIFVDTDAITILSTIIVFKDVFNGATIDTGKWSITNPNSSDFTISQNNKLLFTKTTANAPFFLFSNYIESNSVNTLNTFAVSALFKKEIGFINSLIGFHVRLPNHYIQIRELDGSNAARLYIRDIENAIDLYDFNTSIDIQNNFKVTYDISNNIKFWYWNTSAWVQIGTTQNVILDTSSLSVRLSAASYSSDSLGDVASIDNFYITDQDYTTEIPT